MVADEVFWLALTAQIPKKRVQSTVIPKRKGSRRLISQKSGKGGKSRASHFPKKLKVLRFSKGKAKSTKHQVFSKKEDSEDQAPSFPKRRLEEPSFPPPSLSKKKRLDHHICKPNQTKPNQTKPAEHPSLKTPVTPP
ncbi:hypothetical protein [Adlercreutzia murintestinalis]|uniref:hypothetical protein n=1 Tax=Adlercreutzia murintestinalis TaxID=2941325 RepID=UPI00204099EA|nr:hypothetical protein [Adlercreutzia murintestinalis]